MAREIKKRRSQRLRQATQWRWHLDEVFVKINGETHYLWRAVDHEGEVIESYVTKTRDKASARKFLKKAIKRYGRPEEVVTDRLRSYGAAMRELGNPGRQLLAGMKTTGRKTRTYHSEGGNGRWPDFGKCEVYRSSPPHTPPSTITSTMTDPSNAGPASKTSATRRLPSGVSCWPPEGEPRDFRDLSAFV